MLERKAFLRVIYFSIFFYSLHYALTLYIESSYLEQFIDEKYVGIIYILGALASLLSIIVLPKLLSLYGNYRLSLFLIFLEVISLFGLSLSQNISLIVPLFIAHQVLLNLLFVATSIFLESFSVDETTGRTRGIFLTILNAAVLAGPFFAQFFFRQGDFGNIFLISSVLTIPMFLVIWLNLKKYKDPIYKDFIIIGTLIETIKNPSVYKISMIRFFLEFFYAIMVIYTPIYLNKNIGISFGDILGIILPIALIPFVIFPYLLGHIADRKYGEKEVIIFGFLIMSLSTISLSLLNTNNIYTWALFLLTTRVGASFIEEMTESYFFKHVNSTNSNLIGLFNNLRPIATILAPMMAILFLSFYDIKYIFLALGLFIMLGFKYSISLKDTR